MTPLLPFIALLVFSHEPPPAGVAQVIQVRRLREALPLPARAHAFVSTTCPLLPDVQQLWHPDAPPVPAAEALKRLSSANLTFTSFAPVAGFHGDPATHQPLPRDEYRRKCPSAAAVPDVLSPALARLPARGLTVVFDERARRRGGEPVGGDLRALAKRLGRKTAWVRILQL